MRIAVVGATGMIGQRVVAEASNRGHEVTALSRSGSAVVGATSAATIELGDTAALASVIDSSDATVVSVSPDRTGGTHEPTISAHRDLIAAAPTGRFLVVGGAGSLVVDGVELKDTPDFPAAYTAEATTFSTILDLYRASTELDWSMLSPAPVIAPGQRTGKVMVGANAPVGDSVSAEDFAVALVDELETPKHRRERFTVAN